MITRRNRQQMMPYVGGAGVGAIANAILSNPATQNLVRSGVRAAGNAVRSGVNTLSRKAKNKALRSIEEFAAPAAIGTSIVKSDPMISNHNSKGIKSVTVSNREAIDISINGSSSWTPQFEIELNPGVANTFPFLSNIAAQYQEYKFAKLKLIYIPIAATSTQGDIIMCPFYDSTQPFPGNEIQASDTANSIVGSVWMPHVCTLSPSLMHPSGVKKYIRTYRMSGDTKNYVVGRFQFSTVNESNTNAIGKLYVEYTVHLFGPRLAPTVGLGPSQTSVWYLGSGFSLTGATTSTLTGWNALATTDNLNTTVSASTGVFTLPDGNYRVTFVAGFADTTSETVGFIPEIVDIGNSRTWQGNAVFRPASTTYGLGSIAVGQVWSSLPTSGNVGTATFSLAIACGSASGSPTATACSSATLLNGTYVVIELL